MTSSEYSRITDELLSAYIDNAVTEQERNLVETAAATDAEVAWRLDTLQQTVQLLSSLPELALPRSFALRESHILDNPPAGADATVHTGDSWFERILAGWRGFWRSGSPVYRNLAAASLALVLILVAGNALVATSVGTLSAPDQEIAFSEAPPAAEMGTDMAASEAPQAEGLAATPAALPTRISGAVVEAEAEEPADEQALEMDAQESAPAEPQAVEQPQAAAASLPSEAAGAESAPSAAPLAAEPLALEVPAAAESARIAPQPNAAAAAEEAAPAADEGAMLAATERSEEDAFVEQPDAEAIPETAEETRRPAAAAEQPQEAEQFAEAGAAEAAPAAKEEAAGEENDAEAVAALAPATPQPTPTAQALTAAESPFHTSYPAPQPAQRFDPGMLAPVQILTLGLLAATVLFGGLWWRSRSGSSGGPGE